MLVFFRKYRFKFKIQLIYYYINIMLVSLENINLDLKSN